MKKRTTKFKFKGPLIIPIKRRKTKATPKRSAKTPKGAPTRTLKSKSRQSPQRFTAKNPVAPKKVTFATLRAKIKTLPHDKLMELLEHMIVLFPESMLPEVADTVAARREVIIDTSDFSEDDWEGVDRLVNNGHERLTAINMILDEIKAEKSKMADNPADTQDSNADQPHADHQDTDPDGPEASAEAADDDSEASMEAKADTLNETPSRKTGYEESLEEEDDDTAAP